MTQTAPTDFEREKIYDAQIAPKLLELSRLCAEKGISFIAAAEWSKGHVGMTKCVLPDACPEMRLINYAAKAQGNADSLIFGLMRDAKEHGHSSAALAILGVPHAKA